SSRASAQLPRRGSTGRSATPGTSRSYSRTPATPSYFYDCGPDAVKVVARPPQPPRQMVDYLSIVRASRPHFQRTVYTPDHGTGSSGLGGFSPSDRIDFSVRATTPSRGRTARSWTRTREAGWLQGWRWSCQRAAGRRTAGRFARSAWGHAKAWPSEESIKFWSRPCSQSGFGRITWSAGRGLCRSSESPRELLLRGVAYRLVMAPD